MKKPFKALVASLLCTAIIIGATSCRPEEHPQSEDQIFIPGTDQPSIISFELFRIMAGKNTKFELYRDGNFLFIQDEGLRFPSPQRPAIRTWKTGLISESELNDLIRMVQASGLDALGPYYQFPGRPIENGPAGGMQSGDMFLDLIVDLPGFNKTTRAVAYLSADNDRAFPDMPPALNQLYSALAALMDKATVIAVRNI